MLWFVIPALDEAENLPPMAERLRAACDALAERWHVVVVDDGSLDATGESALRSFGPGSCTVLRHAENRGPGAAVQTGFEHVLSRAAADDLVATVEADGTSDFDILGALVECVRAGADVALASPYAAGGRVLGTSRWRRAISSVANLLCARLLGLEGVSTYSSFYRVHSAAVLRRARDRYGERLIVERGFAWAVELLAALAADGARIAEVPLVLDGSIRIGQSRMRVAATAVAYLRVFSRARGRRG